MKHVGEFEVSDSGLKHEDQFDGFGPHGFTYAVVGSGKNRHDALNDCFSQISAAGFTLFGLDGRIKDVSPKSFDTLPLAKNSREYFYIGISWNDE